VAGEVFLQENSLVTFGSRVQMSALLSLAPVTGCQKCVRVLQEEYVLCGCMVKIYHEAHRNVLNIASAFTLLRYLYLIFMPQRWNLRCNIVLKRISSSRSVPALFQQDWNKPKKNKRQNVKHSKEQVNERQ